MARGRRRGGAVIPDAVPVEQVGEGLDRQGAAVDLAIGRERKIREPLEPGRDHVLGHKIRQPGA